MSKGSSHRRVGERLHRVVIVDENSNPFELGCVTEVFGLQRPEIGRDLYDFPLLTRAQHGDAQRVLHAQRRRGRSGR